MQQYVGGSREYVPPLRQENIIKDSSASSKLLCDDSAVIHSDSKSQTVVGSGFARREEGSSILLQPGSVSHPLL